MATEKLFVEVQDEEGNVYYVHTSADVVFCEDGKTVEEKLEGIKVFKTATADSAGTEGLVPAPAVGNNDDYLRGDGKWGAVNDMAPTFSQASSRANIASGEKNATLFGKIMKWFADMKTGAFVTVVNNLTTTVANTVLDGRQGKILADKIAAISSALTVNYRYRTEGAYLNIYQATYGNIAQIRAADTMKHDIKQGTQQQLYDLGMTLLFPVYREYSYSGGGGFVLIISEEGILYLLPTGQDLKEGTAINFSETIFIE